MSQYYHYFVEGKNEDAVLKALKTDLQLIVAGKVQVFNIVEKKIDTLRLMSLKQGTTVVLVYDTDTGNTSILQDNILTIKKHSSVKDVLCIPQVRNLEDELIRSCKIREIKELTGSKSDKKYKRDLIRQSDLSRALRRHGFNFSDFWNTMPKNSFQKFGNDSDKIRKKQIKGKTL